MADHESAEAAAAASRDFPGLEIRVSPEGGALPAAVAGIDALITQAAPVDATLLAGAGRLRLLVKLGRVYDHIDVEAVRSRGLAFGLVPRKGPSCVAEHALTLILALSKDLVLAHRAVAEGAYRWRGMRPVLTSQRVIAFRWMQPVRLHEVRGRTLGCIGYGEIGCELSLRARALGMRVLYTRRRPLPPGLERHYDVAYRPMEALLDESDYVCVAVPHTDETHHLIGSEELRRIGPNGYLVNVARGGVVDEAALIEALRGGLIAGAGLDVFTYEPLPADSPLCTMDNVILTPHIGGGSGTTRELELREALAEVARALDGGALQVPVT
ncbi:MAG: NAD(P)-dependent oxidoreductase [Armatimonadota bacterium]|nr:NAD(P)-dependent oxidoreductase [Armatimonadota bacterium]MDR7453171.1 NAD(P)-dependent oxidoreductase [Armatimonadota bacterium]